jgi:hypothetical protein
MKARLSELIPGVQASHRVEALARGLEFRTWASLLAWTKAPDRDEYRTIDTAAFVDYLSSRGYVVLGIAFDCAMSLTKPRKDGDIPDRDYALFYMGQDTWDAMFTGYRALEDEMNARIRFIHQSWEDGNARLAARAKTSIPALQPKHR